MNDHHKNLNDMLFMNFHHMVKTYCGRLLYASGNVSLILPATAMHLWPIVTVMTLSLIQWDLLTASVHVIVSTTIPMFLNRIDLLDSVGNLYARM